MKSIKQFYDSLHFRILIPTLLTAAITGAAMYFLINGALSNILKTNIIPTDIRESTIYKSEQIDHIFKEATQLGGFVTHHPSIITFLKEQEKKVAPADLPFPMVSCLQYVKDYYHLSVIYMMSSETLHYYTNEGFLEKLDLSLPENSWYESTLQSEKGYTINIDSAVVGKLNLWYDGIVKDENGTYGVAGFGIDISNVTESINMADFAENTNVAVLDSHAVVRFKRGSKQYFDIPLEESKLYSPAITAKIKALLKKNRFGYGEFESNGVDRFFIVNPLEYADMYIVLDFPKEEILKNYRQLTLIATIFPVVLAFMALITTYYMIRTQVITPINTIVSALKLYVPGQGFKRKDFETMPNEFRIIGKSFDKTSTLLEKSYNDLSAFNDNLEKMIEKQTHELKSTISELNVLNSELEVAKEVAQMAAKSKSDFISGVSHELRTPLNAIINFTDMILEDFDEILQDKELQQDSKEYLKRVLKNSKHLLALINDILEFSKLEAGKIEYDMSIIELNAFLTSIYHSTESLVSDKPITYSLELPDEVVNIQADKRRLTQVLLNLISNAMKFTESGFVKLTFSHSDGVALISVKDSGRGIEASKHEKIFIPFSQINKNDKGTGLGLGIARRFCDDMDMEIKVVSEPDRGSTFFIKAKKAQVG